MFLVSVPFYSRAVLFTKLHPSDYKSNYEVLTAFNVTPSSVSTFINSENKSPLAPKFVARYNKSLAVPCCSSLNTQRTVLMLSSYGHKKRDTASQACFCCDV
jgi:hypothetical protein